MSADTINAVSFRRHHEDFEGFAQDLGSSFARYGFAVISDHELDQARIEAALASAQAFFALPAEIKQRHHVVDTPIEYTPGPSGYSQVMLPLGDGREILHVIPVNGEIRYTKFQLPE